MKDFHSIGQSVFITDKYFKIFLKNELKEYDLNRAEAMTLMMLLSDRPLAELHYDKGVLSRTLQSLEEKGYITRSTSAEDGRANDITVLDSAISVGRKIDVILKNWNDGVTEGIEDIELFETMLRKLVENARELSKEK
ncbi:MAG: MarR family transcriptional regulator [Clostridiales bacterium]|nr:MarR family transcriptional regulator [Candidatus Crickella caballi]